MVHGEPLDRAALDPPAEETGLLFFRGLMFALPLALLAWGLLALLIYWLFA